MRFIQSNMLYVVACAQLCSIAAAQTEKAILTGAAVQNGLTVGLNTSDGRTDWLSNDGSSLIMRYPGGASAWGTVFFTFGPSVPFGSGSGQDMSLYQTLVIEMRGDERSSVLIGVKDSSQADDGNETKIPLTLTSDWQSYSILLQRFSGVDLKKVYIPAELVWPDNQGHLVQVRNIKYTTAPPTTSKVLPQFAFGGGWYSALYFTNAGNNGGTVQLNFIGDDGKPLNVPSVGGVALTLNLLPRETVMIEAPNVGPLTQGYVLASVSDSITGYGVFRQSVPGQTDQEAVVPISDVSSTISTMIWDENFTTAVAMVNPSPVANTVSITIRGHDGQILGISSVALLARTKTAALLRNLPGLAGMVGDRGSADFTVSSGSVAVLGLRFGGSAFTSIPTFAR